MTSAANGWLERLAGAIGVRVVRTSVGHFAAWRQLVVGRATVLANLRLRDALVVSRTQFFKEVFDASGLISRRSRAQRSVVFLNNSYYNFFYLAKALRKRGWDAISVTYEAPDGPNAQFYHGNDLCLYDADPQVMLRKVDEFFKEIVGRFNMVHFYGMGNMSIYPSNFDQSDAFSEIPIDILRLQQAGVKIGYSVCGCLDGVAQSSVHRWSGCCAKCVWQDRPDVCLDRRNLAWGHKLAMFCNLVATEGFPALDYQATLNAYREPLTTALDPDFWHPALEIPERWRLSKRPGELIIYHAVGNFESRSSGGRNLKGTGAVVAAIDRLRREGLDVRLEFVKDVPNTEVRFIQAQADVIVDQLNYGRYGATAREGMMLGKPTICCLIRDEPEGQRRLEAIESCPLVHATEDSVYEVLLKLLVDPKRRQEIGAASREFALKWHSADACAARFEAVYDRLQLGLPVEG